MRVAVIVWVLVSMVGITWADDPVPDGPVSPTSFEAMPDPECLRAIREARIAVARGGLRAGLSGFEAASGVCAGRLEPLYEALTLARRLGDSEAEARQLERLVAHLTDPDRPLQLAALERAVVDPAMSREALEAFRSRLHSDIDDVDRFRALRVLAVVASRLGDDHAARAAIEPLLAHEPTPELRWLCVGFDRRLGNWVSVVTMLEALAVEDPEMAGLARLGLVEAYAKADRPEKALATVDRLLADDARIPGSKDWVADALLRTAWALWDGGRRDQARTALERVIDVDPENEVAVAALELLFGNAEARRTHAVRAQQLRADSDDAEALLDEGTQRLAVGDAEGAIGLLERAAEGLPDNDVAWYNLGLAAIRLERWNVAADALSRADELKPGDPGLAMNLGTALARAGRCESALGVLGALVETHPERFQAHYWRWWCFKSAGDLEAAGEALRRYEAGRAE